MLKAALQLLKSFLNPRIWKIWSLAFALFVTIRNQAVKLKSVVPLMKRLTKRKGEKAKLLFVSELYVETVASRGICLCCNLECNVPNC